MAQPDNDDNTEMLNGVKKVYHLQDVIAELRKEVYNNETTYIERTMDFGNVIQGWGKAPRPADISKAQKKRKRVREADRIFSSSLDSKGVYVKLENSFMSSSIPTCSQNLTLPGSNGLPETADNTSSARTTVRPPEKLNKQRKSTDN
ncbi:Chromatin modification-related protein MEAF6 [Trichinella nelsoni]|uniref:Chromatin modification-related protein MEAF6 n=1 Tax=Trichinella nelsoni TaxID=6336 RepID=A0A0V0SLV3_9BILA|nr:Chromatin modification-related protein MEAF6 [Trichinella nelsoni]